MWGFVILAGVVGVVMVAYWRELSDLAHWWMDR